MIDPSEKIEKGDVSSNQRTGFRRSLVNRRLPLKSSRCLTGSPESERVADLTDQRGWP